VALHEENVTRINSRSVGHGVGERIEHSLREWEVEECVDE